MTMASPDTDLHSVAFFLADHAAVENGKVYVNGGFWDRLRLPSFPAVVSFSVVAVLHIPWRAHLQSHRLQVTFEDEDSNPIGGGFEAEFRVGSAPDMERGDPSIMPIAAGVGGFALPRAGGYAAVLKVDGTEISRWRFRANQVIAPVGPPAESPGADSPNAE